MKKILLLIFLFLAPYYMNSQQDAQFSQFMFNKLFYNPGYAGSAGFPSFTVFHRHQWVDLEGSPISQGLNFHTTLRNERVGAGIAINHDKIGPTRSLYIAMSYAYRIPMEQGTFSIGLQGSLRHYRLNQNLLVATHQGDGMVTNLNNSKLLPNAGLGLYYEAQKFYLGMSLPHIIKGDISLLKESYDDNLSAVENVHAYLMTGLILNVNRNIRFKPAVLIKFVKNAPFDMDINGSFIFLDKLWVGLTYRLGGSTRQGFGESIDFVAQYQITNSFRLGVAYDFTLSEIKNYSNGTYEVLLQYDIQKRSKFTNPRFF